ncbi:hypothetical protein BG842_20250 [Haladaptatus sp. W1]|uniref:hypothetical protein n=1 Tax=Haladaptatus sp. W1 TaxID=1897478 RepID=UPI0008499FA2|nr:hypothetical protein [Haladaptatus sp. W1]ODR83091.1 hypothetical protein BG842_20250 [Haladaptatus sp. W1]
MPDERTSPSGDWREVYAEMGADTSAEGPVHPCPKCGAESVCVFNRVFECEEHGVWALDRTGKPRIGTATDSNRTMAD